MRWHYRDVLTGVVPGWTWFGLSLLRLAAASDMTVRQRYPTSDWPPGPLAAIRAGWHLRGPGLAVASEGSAVQIDINVS